MATLAMVILLFLVVLLVIRFLHRRRLQPSAVDIASASTTAVPVNSEPATDGKSAVSDFRMDQKVRPSIAEYITEVFQNNFMALTARQVQSRLRFWGVCLPVKKVGRVLECLANGPGTLIAQRRYVVAGKSLSPSKQRRLTRYTLVR